MRDYLEFEKPIREIEEKIEKLSAAATSGKSSSQNDIRKLRTKLAQVEHELYKNLTPWQRTQLARHPQRPSTLDYINELTRDFLELHGDRLFGDDRAIVGGFARFNDRPVMIIGHQKGKTLKERMQRNFGMPNPEGYRKALAPDADGGKVQPPDHDLYRYPRCLSRYRCRGTWASRSHRPQSVRHVSLERARLLSVVIGEGGSGGALALGVCDRVLMLEHSVYSVISPEGCAAILWDNPAKIPDAAAALKMTANDLFELGVIDTIVPEPVGGAHREPRAVCDLVGKALTNQLFDLLDLPVEQLLAQREQKYRKMGAVTGLPSGQA